MTRMRLGKTGLMVSRVGFGGIPIQRIPKEEAVTIVRGVIDLGVNFIDTANGYSDSEEKIGVAIKGIKRDSLVISTKSRAPDKKSLLENLDLSLKRLGTDYIDIFHLHNVSTPESRDAAFAPGGAYEGVEEAVKAGKIRFPAFSSHNIRFAVDIMKTGKFAAVQLGFNCLDNEAEQEAIPLAKKLDIGFIGMKPIGGGMIENIGAAMRYVLQFDNVMPDPGIAKLSEMREIAMIVNENGAYSDEDKRAVRSLAIEMGDSWCHRCEYCQPCPQEIGISSVLRLDSSLKRFPFAVAVGMLGKDMEKAAGCVECGQCVKRCPYDLQIPALLKSKLTLWEKARRENT